MLVPILFGLLLGTLCMACHALGTTWWLRRAIARIGRSQGGAPAFRHSLALLGLSITTLTVLHVIEISVWALGYQWFAPEGMLRDAEEAVYFSFITFTTVGYGDIVIDKHWRLMAGIQALNGIMLIGWSTAVLMAIAQKVWQSNRSD